MFNIDVNAVRKAVTGIIRVGGPIFLASHHTVRRVCHWKGRKYVVHLPRRWIEVKPVREVLTPD